MKRVNLRKLYPLYYKEDFYIEVSDNVAEQLAVLERIEHAFIERTRYHRAYYSLDAGDGIERDILFVQMSPQELYERKLSNEELYSAMNKLPEKQAKRLYAYYFQNMSMSDIARIEGVSKVAVRESIEKGLSKIAQILKNL
ncbi:MAG: sigma-70 family RNA polymerase sigma factor [Clostridia bacterium]|nr:sigma-70 family RNA polymerase sigma factor [Clostridia bacterium]